MNGQGSFHQAFNHSCGLFFVLIMAGAILAVVCMMCCCCGSAVLTLLSEAIKPIPTRSTR